MTKEREFEVGKQMLKSKYNKCMVCLKKFKLKERIVLVPIQRPKGDYFINAVAVPIHTKCFWVKKDERKNT